MSVQKTFLFDKIVFGPVKSRRLGLSLGINLLPTDVKLCNFDCVYCECGWTGRVTKNDHFHSKDEVIKSLKYSLTNLKGKGIVPDAITFAGNGEPTMHPDFNEIVEAVISLRNEYFPSAKVAVLTNSSMLYRQDVMEALLKVDLRICKLDAANDRMFKLIDDPNSNRSISSIVKDLKRFKGNLIIQTMFLKGNVGGKLIDNTTAEEINDWLQLIKEIAPKQVMLYSIDRATASEGLEKITHERLVEIAEQVNELGIDTMVT